MLELRNGENFSLFKERVLIRDVLAHFGLVLGLASDCQDVPYNCVVKKQAAENTILDSCKLHLLRSNGIKAEDTPVSYGKNWDKTCLKYEICIGSAFLDLDNDQQNIALAYAASRAYNSGCKVKIKIDESLEEQRPRIENFIKFISKIR